MLLLGAFGATGALWTWQNRAKLREDTARKQAIAALLDDEMQVALHLARHAASTRHQAFSALHLLYAIVQGERVAALIERLGGGEARAAIEAAIDAAVEKLPPGTDPRAANQLLGSALGIAKHHERQMTIVDTLNLLVRTPHGALLEAPPVTPHALLFALVHGDEPPDALPRETHVHVVVRNDDFTTQEFVVEILAQVFDLSEGDAIAKMHQTHKGGRAIVGRFPTELARQKIIAARARARSQLMPLWLGVEVC